MKKSTYCMEIGQGVKSLRGSDRGFDCRLTVVRPSADRRFRAVKVLTVLLLILTIGVGNVFGEELTVGADWDTHNKKSVPLNPSYHDTPNTRCQFIYTSADLSGLEEKVLKGMRFYADQNWTWNQSPATVPTFSIRLKETTESTLSAFDDAGEFTVVYTGQPTGSKNTKELYFEFNGDEFTYSGTKNLLVELKIVTGGGYQTGIYYYGTTRSQAARTNKNESGSNGTVSYLPKVQITYENATPATCPKPAISSAVATSTSTATISWTAGGEETAWNLQYKGAGDADWTSVDLTTSNTTIDAGVRSYGLTGLAENTAYQVKLKAVCGVGDESAEVSSSFKTPCTPIASLDCGFESSEGYVNGTYPDCWGKISSTAYPQVYNYSAKTGSQVLRFYQAGPQYAILPLFNQDVKNLEISFYYKNYGYSETLQIGYMTDPADASTFVALPTSESTLPYITSYNAEKTEISLSGAAVGARYIAFKYNCTSSWGASYVDDISVSVASACKKPASLTAAAASATSIDLSWTAKGEETAWQVQYRVGEGSWSSPVEATTNPFTLTGLTAQTTYEIQVRANCGGEQSDWSASAAATTLCNAQPIPWSENFEGMSNGSASSPAPDCWAYLGLNGGTYPYAYPSAYNDGTKYYKGTRALYMISSGSADSYIILPAFDAPLNTLQLTFSHMEESVAQSGSLVVGYMTNITNASSFVAIDGGACTNADRTWTDEEISLASVPAGVASTARLVIKFAHSSSNSYYSAIDDITVSELPACPKPVLTATNVIYNGATINWADGSSEKKWKLQYKAAGDADWADANGGALIAASSFALDGLTPGTAYQVKAQAECEGDWSNAVSFTPNYVTPTNFQLDAKSANSATISWTANSGESSWTVQYKKSSDGDWTTIPDVTVNPYTITGLTSATTYQVKVAAGTFYTSAITFDTECESVTTFPWEENFESRTENTIVKCWDNSASTASGTNYYKWGVHTSGGNKMMRMCNYYVGQTYGTAIINTPSIEIPNDGKEYELKFDYCHTASCGNFSIKISTDDGESFNPIAGASYPNGSSSTSYTDPDKFTTAIVSLASYNGQAIILQFFSYADWDKGAIFVDNIKIAEKPACANPSKPAISEVTASSAVVTWTSEASEFALQYKKGTGEWQDAAGAIVSPYTLSGLDEQSTYTVQVKAICGVGNESEFVASDAFTTNCAEKALGYEMAFGATLDACWDNSVYGFSSQWIISSESTNYYMRYATNTNASCYGVLQTPAIIVPSDKETIARFQWQNTGATASVKVSVDGATPVDVTTDLSNVTSGWVTKDISLSDYKGHTVVLYFRGEYDAAKNKYLYLDDFTVIEKPCETPTALAAVATSTGATITWTAGGDESQWNLRYREIAEPENAWTLVENVTTGYAITGLEVGHNYEVQVQAYCDATHQSDWTASANFTPVCGAAPTNLAVSARTTNSATLTWEGVESAFKLQTSLDGEAWEDAINVNAMTYNLTGLAAGTTYYVRVQNHCGGEYASASFTTWCDSKLSLPVSLTSFSAIPACWEVSPAGAVTISNNKLCFVGEGEKFIYLPKSDINLNLLSIALTFGGNLDLGYISEPNGTFTSIITSVESGTEYDLATLAPESAQYLAIRYNGASALSQAAISAISIRKTPTCVKPTDVTAVPSVGSATISWTSDAEAWKLQYKTGSAAWTEVSVTEKPYEITGLTQGTPYKVRVQAACAGEELSDWSDEVDFTTSCSGIDAIPYYADFTETLSSCWTVSAQDETYYKPYANTAMNQLVMNGGKEGASNNVVVMPPFSADLSAAVLSFEYNCSTGANNAQLEVGYITDKADVATFTAVETLAKSSSWVEARVPATSFGGNYIAFRYAGGSSHGDLAIRNMRVINQLVLADNVDNSATIAANNGQTLDIQIGRTITCTGYFNTICLPFSLPTLDGTPLEGAELWAFKYAKVENEELLFRIVEASSIEAGKPYFIQFAAGDPIENPLFKNVTISATAGQHIGDASVAQLCGILQPETFVPGDKTKLFLYNENALYWWNGDHDSQLKSFRAYFYVNTTSGANYSPIRHGMIARIIKEEQTATGVDNVQGDNVQCIKMVENDQIVIIKNGVKYNVQGQVISK